MTDERVEKQREQPLPVVPIERGIADALAMFAEKELPVYGKKDELRRTIAASDTLVLEAETGSGKSTVTPIVALEEAISRDPNNKVVITQPRRAAAEGIYKYLGEKLGNTVGVRHGGRSTVVDETRLEIAVEDSLLNEIGKRNNRDLDGYGTVILDEIHEKSASSTLLMGLLKDAQKRRKEKGKPPLKLIVTSATLNKEQFLEYFEGAADMHIEGVMYPIEEHYLTAPVQEYALPDEAARVASEVHSKGDREPGDILIFMPGKQEIEKTIAALQGHKNLTDDEVEFIGLTGGEDSADTVRKINEKSAKRRIFVSTNVAETSLTIEGVRVVIDSGLMRQNIFNPLNGVNTLATIEHTKANARQRRGRAGRTSPGTVHFLFTKDQMDSRQDNLPPEISRVDLSALVLAMKSMDIDDIHGFNFMDKPEKTAIDQAYSTLQLLGALDKDGKITEMGRAMSETQLEPKFARMMAEARRLGCVEEMALVVGMFRNTKDAFRYNYREDGPMKYVYSDYYDETSDVTTRINIWNDYLKVKADPKDRKKWEEENKLNSTYFYNASNERKEVLGRVADKPIEVNDDLRAKLLQCIAVGSLNGIIVRDGSTYKNYAGMEGIRFARERSVLYGTHPDAYVSGFLRGVVDRRTQEQYIESSMNSLISFESIQKVAPQIAQFFQERFRQPTNTVENVLDSLEQGKSKVREEIKTLEGEEHEPHGEQTHGAEEKHEHQATKQKKKGLIERARSFFSNPFKR